MNPGETVSAEASTTWAPAGTAEPTDWMRPFWITTTAPVSTFCWAGSSSRPVFTAMTGAGLGAGSAATATAQTSNPADTTLRIGSPPRKTAAECVTSAPARTPFHLLSCPEPAHLPVPGA